jgi:hypothetical protein
MIFSLIGLKVVWASENADKEIITNPSSNYIVSESGDLVYDVKSQLTWARCSQGQYWIKSVGCAGEVKLLTYDEALQQVTGDWRIPSKDELEKLIDPAKATQMKIPATDTEAFPDMQLSKLYYWTSTEKDVVLVWHVHFDGGGVHGNSRGRKSAVRLVKSGM